MTETSKEGNKKRGCLFWASVSFLAVVLVFGAYIFSQISPVYEEGTFQWNLEVAIENNRQEVKVADLTPFEWESMCAYAPYMDPDPPDDESMGSYWTIFFTDTNGEKRRETIIIPIVILEEGRNICFGMNAVAHFYKRTEEISRGRTFVRFSEEPSD